MRTSNYGVWETLKNIWFVLLTKILFRKVRLIRFPIVIRGKKYIDFGMNLTTGYNCRFEVTGVHNQKKLIFGNKVNMGDNVRISCLDSISIGSNVLIGSKVLIIDNSHGTYNGKEQDTPYSAPNERKISTSPIVIEDNVWIGENVVIQKGCRIGSGSIIAANSVVTRDIPENVIVTGAPARVTKKYCDESRMWKRV